MDSKMIGLTILTLLATSCSQNEVFDNQTSSNLIRFENLNDRISSRSANTDDSDYGIYAFLNGGTPAATTWFIQFR